MGIRHLALVRDFLEANPENSYSKFFLRQQFNIDVTTVEECLEYLFKIDRVLVVKDKKKRIRYQWKSRKNSSKKPDLTE